jgi:antitoxin component of RelBE/YafQ-DinJ toxin-antitoxin module
MVLKYGHMITQQTQIKITLPVALKELIESKAARYGLPISGYIRHLLLREVENMQFPVYKASKKTEKAYKKAMGDYRKGKYIQVENIDEFFDDL